MIGFEIIWSFWLWQELLLPLTRADIVMLVVTVEPGVKEHFIHFPAALKVFHLDFS